MAINNKINRGAEQISALLSGKIDKCEYPTGKKILPFGLGHIIQQVKCTYSPLENAFEKN